MQSVDMLSAMRIFVRVVERGSLSAAARDLGMGQPAVSERISRLEERLSVRLLHRNTRAIATTGEGRLFYERSKVVLDAAAFAESVSMANAEALRGVLRIACPHAFGELVVVGALKRFQQLHPGLSIDMVLNDRIADPVTEGVDVAIRLADTVEQSCICEQLGDIEQVLVAAPSYLEGRRAPETHDDLRTHSLLRVAGAFNDNMLPLVSGSRLINGYVNTLWTLGHWRPLYDLLLNGTGIGVLLMSAAADALGAGQLRRVLPEYEMPRLPVLLLHPKSNRTSEKTRQIVAFLKKELRLGAFLDSACSSASDKFGER